VGHSFPLGNSADILPISALGGAPACPPNSLCGLRRLAQGAASLVHGFDDILNSLDLLLFEQRLPTLLANPGGNIIDGDVAAVAVDMDWSFAPFHGALAVNTVHGFFLIRKSALHSAGSDRYAVMIATSSLFGAQTT
jgi:hypothetical protein